MYSKSYILYSHGKKKIYLVTIEYFHMKYSFNEIPPKIYLLITIH